MSAIDRRFVRASQRRPVFQEVPGRPDLKRFLGYEGDPGTVPAKRARTRSGLGDLGRSDRDSPGFPDYRTGAPGNPFPSNYSEDQMWGTSTNAPPVAPVDPSVAAAAAMPGPTQMDPGISIPFGVSIIKWRNPTTMQSVPILASTPANQPVLSLNMSRNALIVQNNSTATSPDIPPTFYIGFNAQPQVGVSLAIPPLSGIVFDIITPRDAVYVLITGGVGASQVVQGAVLQGTYAPL